MTTMLTLYSEGPVILVGARQPRGLQDLAIPYEVMRFVGQERLVSHPRVDHRTKWQGLLVPSLWVTKGCKISGVVRYRGERGVERESVDQAFHCYIYVSQAIRTKTSLPTNIQGTFRYEQQGTGISFVKS